MAILNTSTQQKIAFGQAMLIHRTEVMNLTQADFGAIIGKSAWSISTWENGKIPPTKILRLIDRKLGVDTNVWIYGEKIRPVIHAIKTQNKTVTNSAPVLSVGRVNFSNGVEDELAG